MHSFQQSILPEQSWASFGAEKEQRGEQDATPDAALLGNHVRSDASR